MVDRGCYMLTMVTVSALAFIMGLILGGAYEYGEKNVTVVTVNTS